MRTENGQEISSGKKAILTIMAGVVILLLSGSVASIAYLLPVPDVVQVVVQCLLYITVAWVFVTVLMKKMGLSLKECRVVMKPVEGKWYLIGILLPACVAGFCLLLPGEYQFQEFTGAEVAVKAVAAVFNVGISAGIVEELIFRGLIMRVLEKKWGIRAAVLIPSVVFSLIHILGRRLDLADILLLFVAGTSVGIMFSLITLQSKSIWNSALVHGIWNVIIIGGIWNIDIDAYEGAVVNYILSPSMSKVLTGGNFGIEASLFAVLGYLAVCGICLWLIRKKVTDA